MSGQGRFKLLERTSSFSQREQVTWRKPVQSERINPDTSQIFRKTANFERVKMRD
jgi:hypothetical protein